MADCTPEQSKLVNEILSIKRTDYYRVLKVEKSATDVEIKKSYRKLAIKLHPDKNKHPKASEAFKVIAKAFEILGDDSKRKMYDMTGADPDSRSGMGGGAAGAHGFPGAGMNGFSGFQGFQGFPQGAGMGGGINEDLLNMLFGMGGMGNNGFSFNFGGNGFPNNGFYYSNNAGMNARRRAQQQQQQQQRQGGARRANGETASDLSWSQHLIQFLPLIIILFSILINSFSGGSTSDNGYKNVRSFHGSVPKYSFEPLSGLDVERTTPKFNIHYYVSEKTDTDFKGRKNAEKELQGLDKYVETKYIDQINYGCMKERNIKNEIIENAQGIIFTDWNKIEQAKKMPMPHCERLQDLGLL